MSNIKVEVDYDMTQTMSPVKIKEMVDRARDIASEIYRIKGWKFNKSSMCIGLRSFPTMMDHQQRESVWFDLVWASTGMERDVERTTVINSVKGNPRSYGGFKRLSKAFDKGTLHKIIV